MSPKPETIDNYLILVSEDKRAALQKLRKAIQSAAPEAEECTAPPGHAGPETGEGSPRRESPRCRPQDRGKAPVILPQLLVTVCVPPVTFQCT
jgi:hypothetical protein